MPAWMIPFIGVYSMPTKPGARVTRMSETAQASASAMSRVSPRWEVGAWHVYQHARKRADGLSVEGLHVIGAEHVLPVCLGQTGGPGGFRTGLRQYVTKFHHQFR